MAHRPTATEHSKTLHVHPPQARHEHIVARLNHGLRRDMRMLAPPGDLLRAGFEMKLNRVKRATSSYMRDRANQATGKATSYAVAAGLYAVAGVFMLAA